MKDTQKATLFKPGESGNPGGRPPMTPEEKQLRKLTKGRVAHLLNQTCRLTEDAMRNRYRDPLTPALEKVFLKVVLDALEPEGDSVKAANFILDRTIGKVKEEVDLSVIKPTIVERMDGSQVIYGAEATEDEE